MFAVNFNDLANMKGPADVSFFLFLIEIILNRELIVVDCYEGENRF